MINQKTTNTSEEGLESLIEDYLVNQNGYIQRDYKDYDRELCLDPKIVLHFLELIQAKKLEKIKKTLGDRFERMFFKRLTDQIKSKGIIEVLRKGFVEGNSGIKLQLFYDRPSSDHNSDELAKFQRNVFSVVRQLRYSPSNEKKFDLSIFINGLPVIHCELKNEFTNQNVTDAIKQFQNDRCPKEELFRFGRNLVFFAIDTQSIYMTTQLKGKDTYFLPFNKGYNNGAGNQPNPSGISTSYLWEEILTKETLTEIIQNYSQILVEKDDEGNEKKKVVFPRYHQLDVVRKLLAHAKKNGAGERYLIQHSAGSGKTNSISWLANQLVGLHDQNNEKNVFDSVIVITDRIVLDKNIQENVKQFQQVTGLVSAIDRSKNLKEALEEGKKIIITTIQKFPYVVEEIGELKGSRYAIIIDEAHSSQSGETAGKMNITLSGEQESGEDLDDEWTDEDEIVKIIKGRKLLTNASYFAFTATPKNKTLELFGVKRPDGKFEAFHLYSMKQAIEEGFILDVVLNYTTYSTYYSLLKAIEDDPEMDKKRAQMKLKKFVESHRHTINIKAGIMIEHFYQSVYKANKINGLAKAMVVTQSIENAIKYKFAFDEIIKENNYPFKSIIAFSGTKRLDGVEFTESSINKFSSLAIPKEFKKREYQFLIVANKYQTGFDQPLLHTMYVDKKLAGVNAVQTLSRLNRTYNPYKTDTFILDFYNDANVIEASFKPYYEGTLLAQETDKNKLFDLVDALDEYHLYTDEQLKEFTDKLFSGVLVEQLHSILNVTVDHYNELEEDRQIDFKVKAKTYTRMYGFLSQIVEFVNPRLERLHLFLKYLINKLITEKPDPLTGIYEAIDIDSYKTQYEGRQEITLGDQVCELPANAYETTGKKADEEKDLLSNIIQMFNDRFGTEFEDNDKVRRTFVNITNDVIDDEDFKKAIKNADRQNSKIAFDKILQEKFQDFIDVNFNLYKKYNDDKDFKMFVTDKLFQMVFDARLKDRV